MDCKLLKEILSTPAIEKLLENYGWMLLLAPFSPQIYQLLEKAIDKFEDIDASVDFKEK